MRNRLVLLLIIIVASFFRLYQLGSIPIELNRDEASIGYTAFSLLKTGADEYGKRWPLNLESFGDWKLPVYEWATIPSIAFFGLSAWSVRLPSALAGVVAIMLVYRLTLLIINHARYRYFFAVLATLLLAISPWHIHFSRMAYEANLGLTLLLAGLVLFFKYIRTKKTQLFIASSFFFGLTMICYHALQLVTPLILISLFVLYKDTIVNKEKKRLIGLVVASAIAILPILFFFTSDSKLSSEVKLSGISIFDKETYFRRSMSKRQYFSDEQLFIAKYYSSIPLEFTRQFLVNATTALNSDFLFLNGGGHGSHDISGIGKIYSATIPLLLFGLMSLFSRYSLYEKKIGIFILFWLVIGLLPALITWQSAHATRSFITVIPLLLISVQGSYWMFRRFSKQRPFVFWTSVGLTVTLLCFQLGSMLITYFIVAPKRDTSNWNWYAKDMVVFLESSRTQVDQVYVQGNSWSPYIYYLFYAQVDPKYAQVHLRHLPADVEGFRHVSGIDNITFGDIPYQHLLESGGSYALFAQVSQLPVGFSQNPQQFDLYKMYSNANSKESYVAIRKN